MASWRRDRHPAGMGPCQPTRRLTCASAPSRRPGSPPFRRRCLRPLPGSRADGSTRQPAGFGLGRGRSTSAAPAASSLTRPRPSPPSKRFRRAGLNRWTSAACRLTCCITPRPSPALMRRSTRRRMAAYAARFLRGLYAQTGAWTLATAWYHSQTRELGEAYRRRVFGQGSASAVAAKSTGPYAPWPPPGVKFGAIPAASLRLRRVRGGSRSIAGVTPPPVYTSATWHGREPA